MKVPDAIFLRDTGEPRKEVTVKFISKLNGKSEQEKVADAIRELRSKDTGIPMRNREHN